MWIFADDVSSPAQHELWMAEGIANGGRSMMLHVDSLVAYVFRAGWLHCVP